MSSLFFTIASFLVALGILITVHEFGHFWVARRLGVKVLRFSIGFGKPIWSRRGRVDATEYVIAALPLGGYVKMLDEREGEVAAQDLPRAFNRKTLGTRIAIVVAGPVFNLLFAVFVYWLIFVVGETGTKPIVGEVSAGSIAAQAGIQEGDQLRAVAGRETPTWETAVFALLAASVEGDVIEVQVQDADGRRFVRHLDVSETSDALQGGQVLAALGVQPSRPTLPPVLGKIEPGEAAEKAGFQPGDRVIAADGTPIDDWNAWVDYVRKRPSRWIDVGVQRDSVVLNLRLRPARVEVDGEEIGRIGAYVNISDGLLDEFRAELRYPPSEAIGAALHKTWEMASLMLRMLGKMVVGQVSVENLSGPISIAQYAGQSASIGLISFLKFLAVVSISLGVLNLLPIPLLDGGHLLYYVIEAIKGSPVSEQVQMVGQQVGLVILLCLMGLAFYLDLERLFT